MYLSKGEKPEIITAKSSEMNVIIPTDDDDYVSLIIYFDLLVMIKSYFNSLFWDQNLKISIPLLF